MVKCRWSGRAFLIMLFLAAAAVKAEQAGSIRGMVYDKDFDAPLAAAQVTISETGQTVTATDEGNYVFSEVEPGTYTLVFSKDGYARQVKADVVVSPEQMTEVNSSLSGDFTEMEEFVVQDVQIGTGTEIALLELRMESPALMDSISSDLMSQAGAGDAASALRLVSGATVQDGKYATIRGLPDRYVNSQMNGVRLPTADTDKRAVQLDQFPSAVIESVQVSKTFTPDQQGDASGGAVNVVLKGIPQERTLKFSTQTGFNTNVKSAGNDFLTYEDGGVNTWGIDDGGRDIQYDNIGGNWDGAVGVSPGQTPTDYKWSLAFGDKWDFEDFRIGAFGSFFYERDSSYYDNGIDDKYWIQDLGDPMTPQYGQGSPLLGEFNTSLFDVTQASQAVKWGGLGVLGFETENHSLNLLYMYTRDAVDKTTLAEDTRGKAYYYPDYDINSPTDPGNTTGRYAAPYLRLQTLEYTERTTETLQLTGRHTLPDPDLQIENFLRWLNPVVDWGVAYSSATLNQPDKRMFGSLWIADSYDAGAPPYIPPSISSERFLPFKSAANFTLGNFQRIWKEISEDSDQYRLNVKLPFEQWSGDEGYLKFGLFSDKTTRQYKQDSFSNFSDAGAGYIGHSWEEYWSTHFPLEDHDITASDYDVDYKGNQKITAWYSMADIPLNSSFNIIGGVRLEKTELSITNDPDRDQFDNVFATWLPPGSTGPQIKVIPGAVYPDGPDASFQQKDILPSIGFEFNPWESVTVRGSYSETVARQTFKELSPIQQSEYLGGDVFIGNPGLQMSALKNYDLRFDYTPYQGGLFSLSWFHKDVTNPIEYVQGFADFPYTYPVNYPKGQLKGWEIEARQQLGHFWKELDGLSVGANATLINSEVTLPDDEAQKLADFGAPSPTRNMTNAPEHLYNFYLMYDLSESGTQFGLFYTVREDTLIEGATAGGVLVADVYEKEYGTLNLSLSQKLGDTWKLKFQAKNLLDPEIQTIYRSKYSPEGDRVKTSYTKGMDFSISLSANF